MSVQTSYSVYHDAKYAGNVINLISSVSRYNDSGVVIPFGYAVVSDGEGKGRLPTAADTALNFEGVAMRELNRAYYPDDAFGAQVARDFTVVQKATKTAVVPAVSVSKDDPVYMGVGADVAGRFTNVAGTGATAAVLLSGVKFDEDGVEDDPTYIAYI